MECFEVSICIVTYNHIKFIKKCIDSIINQETNFKYEILISDDCSQDGTIEVLKEYQKSYPSIIKLFLQPVNIGAQENFIFIHQQAFSKYVCHIDGDDYALPGKLQVQYDFLENNPYCNIVWHRMYTLDTKNNFYEDNYVQLGVIDQKFNAIDLIANITIGLNSSKMYRKNFERVDWLNYYELDFSFNVLKLCNPNYYGAIVNENVYGVYRSSIGVSLTNNYKIKIKIYEWLFKIYKDNLIDKSYITAKVLLLFLSDLKHLKKTMFFGLYVLFLTLKSFRFSSFLHIKKRYFKLENKALIKTLK